MKQPKPLYTHVPHPHRPQNVNIVQAKEQKTFNTRLAVLITRTFGSMTTFYILVCWMLGWILLASLNFSVFRTDPYPFTFLLFLSNLVQLWALPVLAVGQNTLSHHAELQADEVYATTQKSFHDVEQIMAHLDVLDSAIQEILERKKEASDA